MPNEKGIYLEFTPALSGEVFGFNFHDKLHAYLVYRDGKGSGEVVRGGPDGIISFMTGSDIKTAAGEPLSKSRDKYEHNDTPKSRHSTKLDLEGRPPEEVWKGMITEAKRIGKAKIDYNLSSDNSKFEMQNSNSEVRAVLKKAGIDAKKAIPPEVKMDQIPGYENDLSDTSPEGASLHKPEADKPGASGTKGTSATDKLAQSPEGVKFLAELSKPEHSVEGILLKSPKTWTRDEMIQVKKHHYRLPSNDPKGKNMDKQVGEWFSHVYSDKPAPRDATGRIIEPKPVNPPPKKPTPVMDADGLDMKTGLKRVGTKTLAAAKDSGMIGAVKSLQGGLNMMEKWRQTEKNSGKTPTLTALIEDGVLGPKTKAALKQSIATDGTAKAENAQALGGFHSYANDCQKSGFKDLAKKTNATFGSLFRDPNKPLSANAPRHESLAIQDTVNHYGEKKFGRDAWNPIKDDGWIGPKTTEAFSTVAKSVNPDRLTRRLGGFLGFV